MLVKAVMDKRILMNTVKSRMMIVITLLLILLIAITSYRYVSSKSLNSTNSLLKENSNQVITLATSNSDAMGNDKNNSNQVQSSVTGATANAENNRSLPSNVDDNAYLSALDNEQDRLRPEIRRILQAKFSDEAELNTALSGASILQDYLDQPNQDATTMIKRYDCNVLSLTQADQNLIQSLTFDTDERKNTLKNGLKNYQPAVSIDIQIDSQGNAISPCSSL